MGQARHLLSLLALVAVLGGAAGGCGSSDEGPTEGTSSGGASTSPAPPGAGVKTCAAAGFGEIRASGVSCARARNIASLWEGEERCREPQGASRIACSIEGYRCLGTATDRGLAVSCAAPGRSLAFIATRD